MGSMQQSGRFAAEKLKVRFGMGVDGRREDCLAMKVL